MTSRMLRSAWMVLVGLGCQACASAFMEGSKPVTGAPPAPLAVCTVPSCTMAANNAPMAGPTGQTYYVARGSAGPVLYELDRNQKGAAITNHWRDAQGDHFFTYVRTSHAWEYILPHDANQAGVRLVYLKGTYVAGPVAGTIRVTFGTPTARCPMQCRWNVARGPAAPAAPAAAPAAAAPTVSCTKDTDCPGNQVCSDGRCSSSGGAPPPPPPPKLQPKVAATAKPPPAPPLPEPVEPAVPIQEQEPDAEPTLGPVPTPTPEPPEPKAEPARPAPSPPPAPEQRRTSERRNFYWLVGSIATGAAAIGALAWGIACFKAGETAEAEDQEDKANRFYTHEKIAYGLAGGFGALSATALILYFTMTETAETPSRSAGLSSGPGTVGLSGYWRF